MRFRRRCEQHLRTGARRYFPHALAQLEMGAKGGRQGCEFQVVCKAVDRGAGRVTVTGYVEGEPMMSAIRCALAWAQLHRQGVERLFFGDGGERDEGCVLEVDVCRRDLDFYVDLKRGNGAKKYGSSVRTVREDKGGRTAKATTIAWLVCIGHRDELAGVNLLDDC